MEAPAVVGEVELVVAEAQVEAERSLVVGGEEDFALLDWLGTFFVLVASLVRLRDSSDQASCLARSSGPAIAETGL